MPQSGVEHLFGDVPMCGLFSSEHKVGEYRGAAAVGFVFALTQAQVQALADR